MVVGLATAALLLSVVSLFLAGWALVELLAMKKSTHRIQMVNPEQALSENHKELEDLMNPDVERQFV